MLPSNLSSSFFVWDFEIQTFNIYYRNKLYYFLGFLFLSRYPARTFSLWGIASVPSTGWCSDIKKIYIRLSNFRNFRKLMFNFWNVSHIVENEKVPRNHLRSIATSSDVIKEQFTKLSSSICSCVVCYGLWSLSFQWNIRIIQSK